MRLFSIILALLILLGVHAQRRAHPDAETVSAYHAGVRSAALALPYRVGDWLAVDETPPPAAVKLLRPNVMLSRGYFDADGRWVAAVVLVQCKDPRDMAGHFPPVCYPAHGWQWESQAEPVTVPANDAEVAMTRYGFERSSFTAVRRIVVYGLFALPHRGLATDMKQVREAAADYRARGLGAAQVQIAVGAGLSRDEELRIVGTLLESTWPVIESVLTDRGGRAP